MRQSRIAVLIASTVVAVALTAGPAEAQVTFSAPSKLVAGDGPVSVVVDDFNGDRDPDMAVANEWSGNVSVLLGGAGGGFTGRTDYAVGFFPYTIGAGDFNRDGDPDLAVADAYLGTVSVLTGGTGGSFSGPIDHPVGGTPWSVAVGDFNGDGDPDLAIANQLNNTVSVLLGAAGASFSNPVEYAVGYSPSSVVVADFNADGDPDLALADQGSGEVSVLLGSTGGTFGPATNLTVGLDPVAVATGDFNGDGDPDLALADQSPGEVLVLLGGPGASFTGPTHYAVGDGPAAIAVADFNRDGDPDLAVANVNSGNVSVLLGGAGGSFGSRSNVAVGFGPISLASGDFDGDGDPDLAVAVINDDKVAVLLNSTNQPPIAADDGYATAEDTRLTVAPAGVLGNDADHDGDALHATVESGPSHGSLRLEVDGSFTYTPAADFNGSDSFTYRAGDGKAQSAPATVRITVDAVNDAPTAMATRGGSVALDASDSSDPDGDQLTYAWTQISGANVTLSGADTATPSFTAPSGPATLQFQLDVCDLEPLCDTDTLEVTVLASAELTTKTQAMNGDLKVPAGSEMRVGYSFTIPGAHPAANIGFVDAKVAFNVTCTVGTPSTSTFVVPIQGASYFDPKNSSAWYPSGDQASASTYQGSATVPTCSNPNGLIRLQQGGTFSATVTSDINGPKVNIRWHYKGVTGSGGGWSGTYSVIPT